MRLLARKENLVTVGWYENESQSATSCSGSGSAAALWQNAWIGMRHQTPPSRARK